MRLDRLITLNLVQPLRRALLSIESRRVGNHFPVPVLMYHNISDDPEPGVSAYYKTNTSPAVFRQHMQFLADHRYHTISLDQVVAALHHPSSTIHHPSSLSLRTSSAPPRPAAVRQDSSAFSAIKPSCSVSSADGLGQATSISQPADLSVLSAFSVVKTPSPKPVVITFDDGFRSFYTEAFPVLKQHGFTATVFLPTAFIGDTRRRFAPRTTHHAPRNASSTDCLTWPEVRELHQAGIRFGSHTVNHPKLVDLDWPDIKSEISDCKSEIEQRLREPIDAFCYPFAFPQAKHEFAKRFGELLLDTGYTCCTTTELGRVQPGADPFRLKRLPANSLDDPGLFASKLEGGYDWLGLPQYVIKQLKVWRKFPNRNGACLPDLARINI